MDTVIEDDELGSLMVRVNPRARSLVFRYQKRCGLRFWYLPAPSTKEVKRAIENLREKLLLPSEGCRPLIDLDYRLMPSIRLSLILGEKDSFWLIRDWVSCRSFVRLKRILLMKIYRTGCVK